MTQPREVLLGILVGLSRPVLQIQTLFQTKKCHFPDPFSYQTRLQAVPLQSVKSKLGRTGESELAERETGERLSLASLDFLARAFLARVTILRDCSQSNNGPLKSIPVFRPGL